MKSALMVVSTPKIINIGDYIQALAAKQYFNDIDILIERERLSEYCGENVKMIMNGWYMIEPKYWPPTNNINPLYVSFHINSMARDRMLQSDSINYLKKHEPIGCRDMNTMNMLKDKGVDAYFSGCLTLTLSKTYSANDRGEKIYIVDPSVNISRGSIRSILSALMYYILHFFTMMKLMKKFKEYKKRSGMFLVAAAFYRSYSKLFDDDILLNAEFIDQESPEIGQRYKTQEDKFAYAEELLGKYARARCVITSRIHCALPCLSLGTPVIYVERDSQSETSSCRLGGLSELFNLVKSNGGKLISQFDIDGKISVENFPKNKDNYQKFRDKLLSVCSDFVGDIK